MSGSSEPGGRAALQAHKAFALARCRSRLQVRCARSYHVYPHPGLSGCRPGPTESVFQRASKGSLLISPEEALSSVSCQGSGCSLWAGADLHPASQKCGETGVIPPTNCTTLRGGWLVLGGAGLRAARAACLCLRCCGCLQGEDGQRRSTAAAPSPSVRPGENNKILKLHMGGF